MSFIDIFFIGIGLALDASCVCTSNGMIYKPNRKKTIQLALVYGIFQTIMPLIGYYGVGVFSIKIFEYNHLVALVLLSILGVKMIYESLEQGNEANGDTQRNYESQCSSLTATMVLVQGVTTSIDALSVGLTFHNYTVEFVLYAVVLIGIVTFTMCVIAVRVGIEIGTKLNHKAELVGGLVLIGLGIKIFLVH